VPAPGPLLLCTAVALVHLAFLMPALGNTPARWTLFAAAIAVPVVALASYGHALNALVGCEALVLSAAAAGAAAQRLRGATLRAAYLASIAVLLAMPYALGYLAEEFGAAAHASDWRALSPVAGAARTVENGAPASAALLLLWAWPVWSLASRRAWR
jgi:hypothetical protein